MDRSATPSDSASSAAARSWILWTSDEWQGCTTGGSGIGQPDFPFLSAETPTEDDATSALFDRRVNVMPGSAWHARSESVAAWHVNRFRSASFHRPPTGEEGPDSSLMASA